MFKQQQAQQERDDNKYNRKYAIHAIMLEVLRNGPSLMTNLEALDEATRIYNNQHVTK